MLKNKQKLIAIIPARSGSKGLQDKNIRLLNGKPLLAHSVFTAKESGIFDEIFVSTDSLRYADIAKKYGASVPFLRDRDLATDTASSWDVVKDTLLHYENNGICFDIVVMLQPTSPLRIADDISNAYALYHKKNANAIVSVCEVDHHPLWSNTLPVDYSLVSFIHKDIRNKPRQLLEKYYRLNGAIYMVKTSYLMEYNDIYYSNCYAYMMPKDRSIDIDDEVDFEIAEMLFKK
jgi:CMP-N,N'-diacetyllegionaminic acid synthase